MVSLSRRIISLGVFAAWILAPMVTFAIDPAEWRTVVLTDGESRTGKVERLIDGRLQVNGPNGEWLIEADKVATVYAFIPADDVKPPGRPGEIELGIQTTMSISSGTSHADALVWGLSAQAGYQVTEWFVASLRTGLQTGFQDKDTTLFDLVGVATFQIGTPVRFYLDTIIGAEVMSFTSAMASGGLFGAGLGVKVPISSRSALDIGAGYAYSLLNVTISSEKLDDFGIGDVSGSLTGHRLLFHIGVLLYL